LNQKDLIKVFWNKDLADTSPFDFAQGQDLGSGLTPVFSKSVFSKSADKWGWGGLEGRLG